MVDISHLINIAYAYKWNSSDFFFWRSMTGMWVNHNANFI